MKFTYKRLLLVLTLLVTSATHGAQPADAADVRGRAIFEEADRRSSGYVDLEVDLQMILRTAKGVATERHLRIRQLEVPSDGDKVMVVFDSPADIRGTALLSHAHKTEDDDQWLYLPAIKRVKKIAARNKSSAFLGSEFSFEDLALPELEKYTYRFVGEESYQDQDCFVVERMAINKHSGYAKERFWIDQAEYRTLRVEYFDRRDRPVKSLEISGYHQYQDRYWKAERMMMRNLVSLKSTELVWQNYQFGRGFSDSRDFSVNSLRRAR